MGPLDWQKLRESCFIFKNQVVQGVLIFLSCSKNISDWICKNVPDMLQDWQSGSCPDRTQLVGEHPVVGWRLKVVESSRLRRGCKTLMAGVRSITRLQARLADENARGPTSRLVPRMQPSHQPIQILPEPQNFTYFCYFWRCLITSKKWSCTTPTHYTSISVYRIILKYQNVRIPYVFLLFF